MRWSLGIFLLLAGCLGSTVPPPWDAPLEDSCATWSFHWPAPGLWDTTEGWDVETPDGGLAVPEAAASKGLPGLRLHGIDWTPAGFVAPHPSAYPSISFWDGKQASYQAWYPEDVTTEAAQAQFGELVGAVLGPLPASVQGSLAHDGPYSMDNESGQAQRGHRFEATWTIHGTADRFVEGLPAAFTTAAWGGQGEVRWSSPTMTVAASTPVRQVVEDHQGHPVLLRLAGNGDAEVDFGSDTPDDDALAREAAVAIAQRHGFPAPPAEPASKGHRTECGAPGT